MKNCKIQGSGRVTEGEYDNITIEGTGKLVDDVTVNTINVSGIMIAKGKLRAKVIKSIGMIRLFKEASIDIIQIDKGVLTSKSDINSSLLECRGAIRIKGGINSDIVKIEGKGKVDYIVGENIIIRNNLQIENKVRHDKFKVNRIEGTSIEICNVNCRNIEGDCIKVTGKSVVGQIYYTKSLEMDPDSKVKRIVKLDR